MSADLIITIATKKDVDALEKLVNGAYRGENSKKGWIFLEASVLMRMLYSK
jgi:hypothetical protein